MKLLQLLSNPDHVAQMGQNGRDRVLRTYTWSAVLDHMATAIKHISVPPSKGDTLHEAHHH
jgi:hypothetical protein